MPPEAGRHAAAFSAGVGGAFYGLYHLALLTLSGRPVTRIDLVRASLNLVCATLSGALVAYFLGPAVTAFLPWSALRDPVAVGFSVGLFAWELLGVVLDVVRRRVTAFGEIGS